MMNINDLFNECLYYNGVEEKTVLGAALHVFSPVSMDAAEKIYRELTGNDIHKDYAKQLEESEEDLGGYTLGGFEIGVGVVGNCLRTTICLFAENPTSIAIHDFADREIRLSEDLVNILLAMRYDL